MFDITTISFDWDTDREILAAEEAGSSAKQWMRQYAVALIEYVLEGEEFTTSQMSSWQRDGLNVLRATGITHGDGIAAAILTLEAELSELIDLSAPLPEQVAEAVRIGDVFFDIADDSLTPLTRSYSQGQARRLEW